MTKLVNPHTGIEYDISIGADPEFFVAKNNKPVSAVNLVPGDKKNPFKVGYGAVQVDGMALEFNINPAKGMDGFLFNLDKVMNKIMEMVPDYEYYNSPVAEFGKEYIDQQPDVAKALGCEPDYNAYTMDINPRPDADTPFRTASGHIHIGWTQDVDPLHPDHFKACARLARRLDYNLGVPSLLWDPDNRRRALYGKAGAFRPKPYGMEYRVLSNVWLTPEDNPAPAKPGKYLRAYVYSQAMKSVKDLFENPDCDVPRSLDRTAQEIINSNDLDTAKKLVAYKFIEAPGTFRKRVA